MIGKDSVSFEASEVDGAKHLEHNISTIFGNSHEPKDYKIKYSNTSQTRGSKLAKFSNSRFRSLLFDSKLAALSLYKFAPKFAILGHFLSPKNREFGGITLY